MGTQTPKAAVLQKVPTIMRLVGNAVTSSCFCSLADVMLDEDTIALGFCLEDSMNVESRFLRRYAPDHMERVNSSRPA